VRPLGVHIPDLHGRLGTPSGIFAASGRPISHFAPRKAGIEVLKSQVSAFEADIQQMAVRIMR
jgi:hypothetical protein